MRIDLWLDVDSGVGDSNINNGMTGTFRYLLHSKVYFIVHLLNVDLRRWATQAYSNLLQVYTLCTPLCNRGERSVTW